jgi:hypothetical protein
MPGVPVRTAVRGWGLVEARGDPPDDEGAHPLAVGVVEEFVVAAVYQVELLSLLLLAWKSCVMPPGSVETSSVP